MTKIHYRKRFLKGLFIALRIIVSYRLAGIAALFGHPGTNTERLKSLHRKNASLIREKAIEMKGVMIKVGQFLSSRVDFLPDEYIAELSQLQDQVPPHEHAGIRSQIIGQLGRPPEELFSEFDEEPIAAASLGQVHHARLRSGEEVAVKVQYPDIDKVIETDIRMFGILITILRGRYGSINLRVLHEEFSKIIRAELDYVQEGKSADRFRKEFADDARIVIPPVIWEYTRQKVLTLGFVGGIKITDCAVVKSTGIDCKATVDLLAETYSKMIFVNGFFHGDPHPGNIFVQDGPRLVFVDFGMVQAIPEAVKRELRKFAAAVVESDTHAILDAMEKMGFIIEGADFVRLAEVAQELIDKYRGITPGELKALTVDDISEEISNVLGIVEYIQVPNNFILLGRTIGILNGIAFSLNPEINIIEIGKPYIRQFLRGDRRERTGLIMTELGGKISDLWKLPSELKDFLTKANRGDLSVRLSRPEMRELTGRLKSLANVMLLVVLTVTTAVAGLLFVLLGNRPMSLVAAGAAAVLGLLSVFRLMKN